MPAPPLHDGKRPRPSKGLFFDPRAPCVYKIIIVSSE
jgi:hypothetical protein